MEKFMAAADDFKPDIIGMSALLTTTMTYMKTVIDGFEAAGPRPHQDGHWRRADQPDVRRRNWRGRLRADASSAVDLFHRLAGKGARGHGLLKTTATVGGARCIHRRPPRRSQRDPNAKSKYQILYWQDLPSEVKAWDDFDEVKIDLSPRSPSGSTRRRKAGFHQGRR